jgi:serine phosphatase RsbU (regulator of sigma subunit)
MPGHGSPIVEWGSAGQAFDGSSQGEKSGDLHVVAPFPGGALVAVIDGLGHGPEAAAAARAARRVLANHASEPVLTLVERCHEDLRRTRGAVMSLASFDARNSTITSIAVGNVEVVLLRADAAANPPRETITPRGGIVGYQLPPLRPTVLSVYRDDTLIMATDGIRAGFTTGVVRMRRPQDIAASILADHGTGTDDALVLVVRYRGASC